MTNSKAMFERLKFWSLSASFGGAQNDGHVTSVSDPIFSYRRSSRCCRAMLSAAYAVRCRALSVRPSVCHVHVVYVSSNFSHRRV